MPHTIRPTTSGDLDTMTEIYAESVLNGVATYEIEPPSRDEMAARFAAITANGYPYIVALDDSGTILGYAYASAFRTRPAYRFTVEDSIYLAPEARGRGVGKALLANLIASCTSLGFRQMFAVIGGAHPVSVAVHAALGFEHAGRFKGSGYKHGRWLDTILMQLELGDGNRTLPDPGAYPDTLYSNS
ncbi:GNAT family N-acetyltransferase [Pararhizobium sp.]|uniref:GNAT family N-acetyltransferase n=1 Tax=Pararhizobium sp. TaxID=1977563 RepID=UPI002719E47F|nr:GNAT family N-acetyltransferase [Pararhizobium sp.]MDO9416565.1 N-acetyltransferase family protein [Pararhizobium sp.]